MKDELKGEIMTEYAGLRSNLWAYKQLNGKVWKRAKGSKKCVVKKIITFEDNVYCLHSGKDIELSYYLEAYYIVCIRSEYIKLH